MQHESNYAWEHMYLKPPLSSKHQLSSQLIFSFSLVMLVFFQNLPNNSFILIMKTENYPCNLFVFKRRTLHIATLSLGTWLIGYLQRLRHTMNAKTLYRY